MIPQRILFVDDDIDLGNFVNMALTSEGYKVHFQNSLIGIENVISEFSPSIILFDVEIGEDNGIERAKNVLTNFNHIPIIFVSSHTDESIVAKGITTGGVAYIRKPFSITELIAYIKRFALDTNCLYFGYYKLNSDNQDLFYNNSLVKKLSKLEFKLLNLLVSARNEIIDKESIADTLWEGGFDTGNEASLNNLISKLRELLAKDERLKIQTIRGRGFQLTFTPSPNASNQGHS